MAGEPCEVTDCTQPAGPRTGLCTFHAKRRSMYGSAEDWAPIPYYKAEGTTDDHLAMLVDLRRHGRLTGYCEAVLTARTPPWVRRLPDHEFWPLFARWFPIR